MLYHTRPNLLQIMLLLLLCALTMNARASDPWHGPYDGGTALWHFDQADATSPNAVADEPAFPRDAARRLHGARAADGASCRNGD